MGLNIKDIPQGGGGFFRPDDHRNAAAILVEVRAYEPQRPGQFGPKDSVVTDLTIFSDEAALDSGEPSEVSRNIRIEYTVLTRDLADEVGVGGATIVKLDQHQSKKPGSKPAWVWRQVSLDTKHKVLAYAEKREAERAAALDAAPDFD